MKTWIFVIFAIGCFATTVEAERFNNLVQGFLRTVFSTLGMFDNDVIRTNQISDIDDEYDFVIVGSGSAGSVLASRLSEIAEWRVLLLEVGKPENGFTSVPLFAPLLQWTDYDWKYVMEPQDNFCLAMEEQRCAWPRGKALGGSTVINYMIYTRGHRLDYDRWAAAGNPGWSYADVLPYFLKSENVHLKEYDEGYHNRGGYLSTSDPFKSQITAAFLNAAREMGEPVLDYNGREQKGFSYMQATIRKGRRHSVAKAFLQPALRRKNLDILTEAMVTQVVIDPSTKEAKGVKYIHMGRGYEVHARKEVIVSGGSLNSPHLLMLSGIGPREHLQELGIPVVEDLPVGRNLHDHISYVGLVFTMNVSVVTAGDVLKPRGIVKWTNTGEGPLSSLGGIEAIGFIKTNVSTDPEDYPDVELVFVGGGGIQTDGGLFNRRFVRITDYYYNAGYKPLEGIPSWTVFPMLLHPKSTGYLKLQSSNPYDPPLFYGNYFSDPDDEDRRTLIESIRYTIRLSETRAFREFGSKIGMVPIPGCEQLPLYTDQYWSCALEHLAISLYHQLGTCKMGPPSDREAVVSPELKVYGVKRLRVVDSSVIPFALSAHTNAPTIMIGEKASDLIKRDWLGVS